MASKSALVTGAAGHTGTFLLRLLKQKGWHVVATDLKKSERDILFQGAKLTADDQWLDNILDKDDTFITADLTKKDTLKPLFEHDFDVIFSIASLYDYFALLDDLMRINVDGLKNLIELTLKKGTVKKFIHWSTCGVYGQPKYKKDAKGFALPADETAPYDPPNNYSISKMEQEKLLKQYPDLPTIIVRPAPIMGPYQTYGMFHTFFMQYKVGMTIVPALFPKKHKLRMPCIHVEDLVRAAYFLAEYEPADNVIGEAFNIIHDCPFEEDFVQLCAESMGLPYNRLPIWWPFYKIVAKLAMWFIKQSENKARNRGVRGKFDVPMAGYITHNYYFSNQKIKDLGFEFKYTWEQGVIDTLNWYYSHGWLERGFYKEDEL
ncbi:MAG: NAD-dependent epimerase/dehydratase family protein [Candidatus Helarchaeota archaeon]